jgi:hypothetical protein
MIQEKPTAESALVIESGLSPVHAIETATVVANVRGKVGYSLQMLGNRRYKVTLTQGTMEDLRKALIMAKGVKIVEPK